MNADKEVDIAISRLKGTEEECEGENDYVIECYRSALKAYKSLIEDGHSGMSWNITKNILLRLVNDLPLSPITEEDEWDTRADGSAQCVRYTALFRERNADGSYSYSDIHRCTSKNGWGCGMINGIVNDMFPITLPYSPSTKKYVGDYVDFAVTGKIGYFDTRHLKSIKTPEGDIIEINKYQKETDDGWVDITEDEYNERKKQFVMNCTDKGYLSMFGFSNASNDESDRLVYHTEPV